MMWRKIIGTSWVEAEQRFKTIREALLILALLIGGIWTILHFRLSESNSAKVRLDRMIAENKAIGLQGKLDIKSKMDRKCILIGQVSLQNYWPDKIDVQIDLNPSIEISPVEFVGGGHFIKLATPSKVWINDIGGVIREPATIVPGRTVVLPFAAEVEQPGLYLVRFRATVTRIDENNVPPADNKKQAKPTALRPVPSRYSQTIGQNSWSERQIVDACAHTQTPSVSTVPNTAVPVPIAGSNDAT